MGLLGSLTSILEAPVRIVDAVVVKPLADIAENTADLFDDGDR